MSIERPPFHPQFENLIQVCHRLAYQLGGDPELLDTVATQVIATLLDAVAQDVPRTDIEAAVKQGFRQGELQCADASLTPEYWAEVRREIEDGL